MVLAECAGQRLATFIFIRGRQHAEVGDAAQVGDVVGPGMGGTVGADEFIEHGDAGKLLMGLGLDAAGIEAAVLKRFGGHLSLVKPAVNE